MSPRAAGLFKTIADALHSFADPGSAKATPKRARKPEAPSTASSAPEVHTPAKRPKYDRSVPGKELLWSPELDEVLEDGTSPRLARLAPTSWG